MNWKLEMLVLNVLTFCHRLEILSCLSPTRCSCMYLLTILELTTGERVVTHTVVPLLDNFCLKCGFPRSLFPREIISTPLSVGGFVLFLLCERAEIGTERKNGDNSNFPAFLFPNVVHYVLISFVFT